MTCLKRSRSSSSTPTTRAAALRPADRLVEPVDEQLAARETGELVVEAALLELARGRLLLGDVAHDRSGERAAVDRRGGDRDPRLELLAVGAGRHDLHRDPGPGRADRLAHPHLVLGRVRQEIGVAAADHVGGREPEDALRGLVELEDPAGVVVRDDRVGRGLEDAAHAQLRHAQRVLGPAPGVDVVHAHHDAAHVGIVEPVRDRALEPLVLAVGTPEPKLDRRHDRRVVGDGEEPLDHRVHVVGVHEIDRAAPDEVLGRVAEHRFGRGRDPREPAVGTRDRDDVGAVLRERGGPGARVDELADVVRHRRDEVVVDGDRDHPPPGRPGRSLELVVGLDAFPRRQRRLQQWTDLGLRDRVGVRRHAVAFAGPVAVDPAIADVSVGVEDLPVDAGLVPHGPEDDVPDLGALERRARELSHIGFSPHISSIGVPGSGLRQ